MDEIQRLQDRVQILEHILVCLLRRIPDSAGEDLAEAIVADVAELPYRGKPHSAQVHSHPARMKDRSDRVRRFFVQEGLLDDR